MLNYKIKRRDITEDSRTITLSIDNIIYNKKTNKAKIKTLLDYKLYNGQEITLSYNNSDINFSESYNVSNVSNKSFEIDYNPRCDLTISSIIKEQIAYKFIGNDILYNEALKIELENEHFYRDTHYGYYVEKYISEDLHDMPSRQCINDNIIYNGFLYNVKSVTENKEYNLENEDFLNIRDAALYFRFNDREIILNDCIILLDEDKNDIVNSLIVFYNNDNKSNLDYILKNYYNANIYCDDIRFFNYIKYITDDKDESMYVVTDESENSSNKENTFCIEDNIKTIGNENLYSLLQLRKDSVGNICTEITTEDNNIKLQIPLNELFSADLYKEDNVNAIFDNIKKESINKIIDYEKYTFIPMYINTKDYIDGGTVTDSMLSNVNSIEFNMHFRERKNELDTEGNVLKEWVTYDEGYWNMCSYDTRKKILTNKNLDSASDILGYLNFDDDDVYYQKNSLKKSFIRLSFYDSRDRATQVLQFYTTIFFDTGKMFTKYIKNINNQDIKVKGHYTNNETKDDEYRLDSKIIVSNKFNKDYSCEGFYLYLFPDVIKNNEPTPLYMKIEFNHAKYGRTIPFLMPTYSSEWDSREISKKQENWPISTTFNEDFPVNYMKANNSAVNMKRVLNDMYIKVYVKYDMLRNQYVWFLPRHKDSYNGTNNKLIFNLWEPRIKGIE